MSEAISVQQSTVSGPGLFPSPWWGGARGGGRHHTAALLLALAALLHCSVAQAHPASCRITNRQGVVESAGSGTLVDVTDDGSAGLVLTCAHLFSEGAGEVIVSFPQGGRHGAKLVAIDREADLAAVEIATPRVTPAALAVAGDEVVLSTTTARFRACGFGGDGRLQCTSGRFVGTAGGSQRVSWKFAGAVRSGDSGGGVFDEQGRLVAVVWGATDGVTYASGGGPLRNFLQRVLGRRTARVFARRPRQASPAASCPDGLCPLVGPDAGPVAGPAVESPAGRGPAAIGDTSATPLACDCQRQLAELDVQVRKLHDDLQQFARHEQLDQFARADELAQLAAQGRTERQSLAERIAGLASGAKLGRAAGTAAAGALGVTGPVGWGLVAAATVSGWWLGRRLRNRALRAQRATQPAAAAAPTDREATADAAETFREAANAHELQVDVALPIERDDREARQLLRLSQLEGRDPLQDAVAGRLALDRLDALADGDDDSPRRTWADELRRELRERFNDIAPTKLELKGEGGRGRAEGSTA
ncbi:MAG: hypothetical protein CMJ58_26485 [Planctomycetaceae bacterium]|nr:hypothetical protein [Planctomycetaceae bacterium]